jgi:hypothetical protein
MQGQEEEGEGMTNHWWPTYIAEHEAMHAVAAQKMGLPVSWVSISPGEAEGIHFAAAVCIPDELIDMERDKLAICVSMSAPSHLTSHRVVAPGLWHYAQIEADMAYEIAGRAGITFDEVWEQTAEIVNDSLGEMAVLAQLLVDEGRVEFDLATA